MKKILTWTLLFQKRILKRPMFLITILLIPLIIGLLYVFSGTTDGLIQAAIYYEDGTAAAQFAESMIEKSDDVIRYYRAESEEALRTAVETDRAECGFILAEDFDERIASGNGRGLATVVIKQSSVANRVLKEVLCGELFSKLVYQMTEQFITEDGAVDISSEEVQETLQASYESYRIPSAMFEFQYTNGEANTLLNGTADNYYMMPVRGLLSVLILLAALGGVLMLREDDRKGCWQWIHPKRRPVFHIYFILMSVTAVAVVSLIALFFTGLDTGAARECALMLAYCLLVAGFANLIRVLIPDTRIICALLPVMVLMSLILTPVFVDLDSLVPGITIVRLVLPSSYYLNAIYASGGILYLFTAALIFIAASMVIDWLKRGHAAVSD